MDLGKMKVPFHSKNSGIADPYAEGLEPPRVYNLSELSKSPDSMKELKIKETRRATNRCGLKPGHPRVVIQEDNLCELGIAKKMILSRHR
jgi:hypothetical protein